MLNTFTAKSWLDIFEKHWYTDAEQPIPNTFVSSYQNSSLLPSTLKVSFDSSFENLDPIVIWEKESASVDIDCGLLSDKLDFIFAGLIKDFHDAPLGSLLRSI